MHAANRIVKNTGILYIRMAISVFISLYSTRLIIGALGTKDFGIFNVVAGAISMLAFLNAAMAGTSMRFMSFAQGEGNEEKQKNVFNVSVILHLIIGFLAIIIIETIGYLLFKEFLNIEADRIPAAKTIFHFMVVSTFFTIISVPYDAVIYAHENMLLLAIVGVIEAFLKLSVAIYITYTSFDKLVTYGLLMASIAILLMVTQRIYCHLKYKEVVFAPGKYYKKNIMKEMTGFAGWIFLNSATSIIGNYGLGIVLNNVWGTALNAAQGIAMQLNGQFMAFSNTMMKALNPGIVKAEGGGDRNRMLKMAMIGCKFSFFLFVFFAAPFLIEAPYILKLWLKTVPDWTIIFCRLAIIKTIIEQLTQALDPAIAAEGNIKLNSIVKSILNLIPLPLIYYLFTKGFPPYTMYIVSIIIWAIIGGAITLYFSIRNCKLNFSDYIKYVISTSFVSFIIPFLIGLIPIFTMPESFERLVVVVFTTTISFAITVYTLGLTQEERTFITGIIKVTINRIRVQKQ